MRLQPSLWPGLAPRRCGPCSRAPDAFAACRNFVIAGGAGSIVGPFTLVSGQRQTASGRTVITKPTLIYFDYTSCPDVCPPDSARSAEALDLPAALGHHTRAIFISIDPARDTPEIVDAFVGYMHENMITRLSPTLCCPNSVSSNPSNATTALKIWQKEQPASSIAPDQIDPDTPAF